MSKFTDALHAFVGASIRYEDDRNKGRALVLCDESDRALAQAGDVLESALRQMMREELSRLSHRSTGNYLTDDYI